jgi:hypothetical protein
MGGWLAVCGRGLRNMFCFVMAFVQGGVNVWAIHCTVATGSGDVESHEFGQCL